MTIDSLMLEGVLGPSRSSASKVIAFGLSCAFTIGVSGSGSGCRTYDSNNDVLGDGGAANDDGAADATTRAEPPVVHGVGGNGAAQTQGVVVSTVAGSNTRGAADGIGVAAQFDNPVGIAADATGILYVTEYDGGRVRKINLDGSTVTLAVGLADAFGLVLGPDALYVQTDRDNAGQKGTSTGTIWKLPLTGGIPEPFALSLGRPRGLTILLDGRIAFTDRTRHLVSVLNPVDRSETPLAGSGLRGFADGRAGSAQFNDPYGAATLPDGSIVIADSENHCLRRATLAGDVTVFAGDRNPGMRDDNDKMRARFDRPVDVAADAIGNVYVSDSNNKRIRRISPAGAVETIAGDGTRGYLDGPGSSAKFFAQEQLDVSADGKVIYLTDGSGGELEDYHRIRRITLP
jgi:hypothetical protein